MSVSATRILIRLSNAYRRVLAVFLGVIGPRAAYSLLAVLARWLYRLFDPLRIRSEAQCQAALGQTRSAAEVADIAEQAFIHRAWNLADLMLADRLIRRGTYHRYGGRIPEPCRGMMLDAQRRRQPVILLTGYYGPFDLLPLFLGYNGIRAGVVYRAHANPDFDAHRLAIRARSGCEMIPDTQAVSRLPQILENGGTVAILSDHHAAERGIPVTFLGLETAASRSVGLLASHYEAVVVVAGIRRLRDAFRFEVVVADLLDPSAWRGEDDPVVYITERYVPALETIVRDDPRQYLWVHARWGEGLTRQLTSEAQPTYAED
ncbi:MAG: lysophospholipid acyltransferase family protein [Phycisphaerae bacterium]|nr:lysophospholipid acyltransferase family protein [Phycisphaerae bacterium]